MVGEIIEYETLLKYLYEKKKWNNLKEFIGEDFLFLLEKSGIKSKKEKNQENINKKYRIPFVQFLQQKVIKGENSFFINELESFKSVEFPDINFNSVKYFLYSKIKSNSDYLNFLGEEHVYLGGFVSLDLRKNADQIRNKNILIGLLGDLSISPGGGEVVFGTEKLPISLHKYLWRNIGAYGQEDLEKFLGKSYEWPKNLVFEKRFWTNERAKRVSEEFFKDLVSKGLKKWTPASFEKFSNESRAMCDKYIRKDRGDSGIYWALFLSKLCIWFEDDFIKRFDFSHKWNGETRRGVRKEKFIVDIDDFVSDSGSLNPEESLINSERIEIEDSLIRKLKEFDPNLMEKIINGEIDLDTKDSVLRKLIQKGPELLKVA